MSNGELCPTFILAIIALTGIIAGSLMKYATVLSRLSCDVNSGKSIRKSIAYETAVSHTDSVLPKIKSTISNFFSKHSKTAVS